MIASTDPIADMLTRIRNGIAVGREEILVPYSQMKEAVAKVLLAEGFLASVKTSEIDGNKYLAIGTARPGASAIINHMARLSKPGRRMYAGSKRMPSVKRGRGIVIVSTSKGVMTGSEAKAKKLGGELICEVF